MRRGRGNWAPRMGEVDKLVRREVVASRMGELGAGDGGSGCAGDGEVDAPVRREGVAPGMGEVGAWDGGSGHAGDG